jgi:stearoyl-CoA desaturase (delta-9 desaturase)
MLIWGFFISTAIHFHATVSINSIAHLIGRRRYNTPDTSRNNFWLSIITLGEGWHNNHHHFPISARQGFYWWEIDPTYWALVVMSWLGIVRDLRPLPEDAKKRNLIANEAMTALNHRQ